MNVDRLNHLLSLDNLVVEEVLPKVVQYRKMSFQFQPEFGLSELPTEPGIILVRGARQFGKSTWLELELAKSYRRFGPSSTFYLNGDEIALAGNLLSSLESVVAQFAKDGKVKRLFIDEITSVDNWEKAIKVMADRGSLDDVLVITTGSKASDIRRGAERLPGRRGKLRKNNFIFTPFSFKEFKRVVGSQFKSDLVVSYILAGGSPLAANELATQGFLPDFVISLTRDWLIGEIVRSGRQRAMLMRVFEFLHKHGGNPVSYSKLAREADFANNTVASGYIDQLLDLLCVTTAIQCDPANLRKFYRKASKFHFCNTLAAVSTSSHNPRSVKDFAELPGEEQGKYFEWLVAQELWRRNSINSSEYEGELSYMRSNDYEIDFVVDKNSGLEVKKGQASPHEFQWLTQAYPKFQLRVICKNKINQQRVESVTIEEFLLE